MADAKQADKKVPEVLLDFADGGVYIKHKMENAVLSLERRRIERDEAKKAARAMESLEVQKQSGGAHNDAHVKLIMKELGVEREEAEKALAAEKGDLVKTLTIAPWHDGTVVEVIAD